MISLSKRLSKALHLPFGGGVFFLALLQLGLAQGAYSAPAADRPEAAEPASNTPVLDYQPPDPGSYELMRIMTAADGLVLDVDGNGRHLKEFTGGKVTLLSFIYSTCADPNGCPYAYLVFNNLKNRIAREPKLAGKVRLVSLSFDPKRDTPEMLKLYAGDNAQPGKPVEWDFLTTASYQSLMPILEAFGQDVFIELDPVTREPLGTFSHVLKVFLIDRERLIREVYTTVYLQGDVVYNDILTLLMEQGFELP